MPIYGMTVEPLLIEQSGGFRYAWVITPEIKVLRYQWRSGLSNNLDRVCLQRKIGENIFVYLGLLSHRYYLSK